MSVPSEQAVSEGKDKFPVGMQVLLVDDEPSCLELEPLLRECRYHVTTTNEAITTLNLLRDSKNKFDLVIVGTNLTDMDSFKLLEIVVHEMDLPAIMVSSEGDTKVVMKAITLGACDYLLKPVRVLELMNIWTHVHRRLFFRECSSRNEG